MRINQLRAGFFDCMYHAMRVEYIYMEIKIYIFKELAKKFNSHGFNLYLVGGTVRDYLLGEPLTDVDCVSEATPEEIASFLPKIDKTFIRFGYLKFKSPEGVKFDITTLRKESAYLDGRHPSKIEFVKDLKDDFSRRDFTVNALYMDKDLNVIDYAHGQEDLKNHLLRAVGDPETRLKEDPLRILRAIRFHLMHNLDIEESLLKAMHDNFHLLKNTTDAKIRSELAKIDDKVVDQQEKERIFQEFDIANLVGVIK